jgi:2'-5' RNA ligase
MARAFIAIDLSDSATDHLAEIASGLRGAVWVLPDQYHLTLRFLGDLDDPMLENVQHTLHDVQAESFYFDLKGVGHFPLRGTPEVLWAGVTPVESLQRLRNRVESALARAGVSPDGRKFHPHITLGRIKNVAARHIGGFEVVHSLFGVAEVPAQHFHLYTSRLAPEGAEHTMVASYPLAGILEGE